MTSRPWAFDAYRASGREGIATVPGGELRYRLAGAGTARTVVVFESGWTAPFPYAVWLEHALAPHVRMLSYDRAGVGDSRSTAPRTPSSLTQQLVALLSHLGIEQPVVVVGHSYGGLIAALHAAQAPSMVRRLVQIDPTTELRDAQVDAAMRILPVSGRILQLCAWLRIDGTLFLDLARELPAEIFEQVKRDPRWLVRSLSGAIAEIRLLDEIRTLVAYSESARQCPRLVVSSVYAQALTRLQKLLVNEKKARNYWNAVQALHRRQAALNGGSRWMQLPYNHVSLVTERRSAEAIAESILAFVDVPEA